MLFTSPVYSQVSGSIAGITYFHGRSGLATRARSTPTNPNTARQRTIRHAIARLGSYWGQTLTDDQRNAWLLYASNVAWNSPLGQTTYLTGQQHFTRCNVPRIQASIAILDAAPIIYDLGTFTAPVILAAFAGMQEFAIKINLTDDWSLSAGGYMLIYEGRPTGPGRGFFKGPFRLAGNISGPIGPPNGEPGFTSVWGLSTGNLLWVHARVIQVDGRLSSPIMLGPHTVT